MLGRAVSMRPEVAIAQGMYTLRRSGITETALNRLQSDANWNELNTLPLHRALAETSRLLDRGLDFRARTAVEAMMPRESRPVMEEEPLERRRTREILEDLPDRRPRGHHGL